MSAVDIIYNCKQCGWSYSLQRNNACPMCKTPPEIDESLVVETIQEYARRKGLFVSKKEAKSITSGFERKYDRLPSFKELWSIADKVVLQKSGGESVSLEEKVEKKIDEIEQIKDVKTERRKEIEERRKGVEKPKKVVATEKVEEVEISEVEVKEIPSPKKAAVKPKADVKCLFCGATNPGDSKFCLECGSSLEAGPEAKAEKVGIKCGKCGKINPQGEKFCLECGVLLSYQKVEAEPPEPKKTEKQKQKPKPLPMPEPVVAKQEEHEEEELPAPAGTQEVAFDEKDIPSLTPPKMQAAASESATALLKTREFVLQEKIMAFRETLKVMNSDKDVLGFFVKKIMSLGDTFRLKDLEENDILTIHEKAIALRPTFRFYWGSEVDENKLIGSIKQKLVAIKPSYWFEDQQENKIFTAKGNLFKYEFEIEKDGKDIAEVSKKLFKIKDTYGIRISEDVDDETSMLILGFCIMLQSQKEREEQKAEREGKKPAKAGFSLKF